MRDRNDLLRSIREYLDLRGYHAVSSTGFTDRHSPKLRDSGTPVYARNHKLCDDIYNRPRRCHFILWHPLLQPNDLVIEVRWQGKGGSTDEKYPFIVMNIKEKFKLPTIIVLDGDGYSTGAEKWLRTQTGCNLLEVFDLSGFKEWGNAGHL